jgi:CheY-like chemotaxis protein
MTRRILCVDDNVNITTFLTHTLSAMGHTVSVANDCEEAIAKHTCTNPHRKREQWCVSYHPSRSLALGR